jgi:hypothetical protein
MSFARKKTLLLAGLTVSLVLAGCRTQSPSEYPGGRAQLPQTKPPLYGPGEVDPVQAHLAARSEVDPRDLSAQHKYTQRAETVEEEIKQSTTEDARFAKLENQVADLRSDFKRFIVPAVTGENKDPAIETLEREGKIDDFSSPGTRVSSSPELPPPAPQVVKKEMPAPAAAPAAPVTGSATAVTGVRVGEHPNRTRLVLDVTGPTKFSSGIDPASNILTVELPQSGWSGAVQESLGASPLVKGYKAAPSASGGTILTVELKKPAKVVLNESLGPNEVYGHRIVFDVAPL